MAAPNPTEVGRKLRQHDNELAAVYDLLTVVDGKVGTLDGKVDTLDGKVGTLDAKVDTLEAQVAAGFERLESGSGSFTICCAAASKATRSRNRFGVGRGHAIGEPVPRNCR